MIWTTYGTWLHGDKRGWVQTGVPGIQPHDPRKEEEARRRMAGSAVVLTATQRQTVEATIRSHCDIRGWVLHAVNVRSNHVHVVVSADRRPEEVMNQLKAWTSRCLSDSAGLHGAVAYKARRRRWWAEHGVTKRIEDDRYLENAVNYVSEMQGD